MIVAPPGKYTPALALYSHNKCPAGKTPEQFSAIARAFNTEESEDTGTPYSPALSLESFDKEGRNQHSLCSEHGK
jgi:hypothetical protein